MRVYCRHCGNNPEKSRPSRGFSLLPYRKRHRRKNRKTTSYGYVVKNSSITVLDASIKMAFKLFDAEGTEKVLETSKAPLHDKNGKVCGIMIACQDVTGRMIQPAGR